MKKIRIFIIMSSIWIFFISFFNACAKSPDKILTKLELNEPYDVIIVPGVPYKDKTMSKVLMGRIYWSYFLYKNGYAKNIIYSGSAVYTPYIESKIMAMYGKAMGIPENSIITETEAEHSVENVYYSYQLAKKLGFKKIALATDPFQSRMVKGAAKRMNVDIDFVPFSFDILDTMQMKEYDINEESAFVENFVSLEERETFFKRLQGTLGRNIDYKD